MDAITDHIAASLDNMTPVGPDDGPRASCEPHRPEAGAERAYCSQLVGLDPATASGRNDAMTASSARDSHSNITEYSVSEISGSIKRTMEDAFGQVRIRGEISGYRGPHSSGHAYFALKDDRARIEAVIWRGVFSR